jgi:hypothetical protein
MFLDKNGGIRHHFGQKFRASPFMREKQKLLALMWRIF